MYGERGGCTERGVPTRGYLPDGHIDPSDGHMALIDPSDGHMALIDPPDGHIDPPDGHIDLQMAIWLQI